MRKKIERQALREHIYRRRFLIPNAVTLANMFCGFLAIIYAASDRFEKACLAIAIAIMLDGLDGRVARRLNATSKFGLEFDSFSDLISFGIAPALVMYYWAFRVNADEFGVAVNFIYALCAASRLARFNISAENLKSFDGLPTPGAAGFVVAFIHFMMSIGVDQYRLIIGTTTMLVLGYLMVSKIEFMSIKALRISRLRILGRICLGILIALIWYDTAIGFLTLALIYCASGPFKSIFGRNKKAIAA